MRELESLVAQIPPDLDRIEHLLREYPCSAPYLILAAKLAIELEMWIYMSYSTSSIPMQWSFFLFTVH
jgi:hypothetical protein